jgi:hypothetical protein
MNKFNELYKRVMESIETPQAAQDVPDPGEKKGIVPVGKKEPKYDDTPSWPPSTKMGREVLSKLDKETSRNLDQLHKRFSGATMVGDWDAAREASEEAWKLLQPFLDKKREDKNKEEEDEDAV